MDKPVGGWKVGRITGVQAEQLGAERLVGPALLDALHYTPPYEVAKIGIFSGGFAAAEAEFMLRLKHAPDPEKLTYTLAEAKELIDEIRVGFEIASSPFAGINSNGACVTASDMGNCKALVLGAALTLPEDADFECWNVAVEIDGVPMGEAQAQALPDGPYGAVRFLLENLAARGIALHAGQWISTGAITGVHTIAAGQNAIAHFGKDYKVSCAVTAA